MGDKKPSGMTLTTPAASDLLFFERPADTTARYSTVGALVQSQVASLTEKGAVELATTAEAQTGTDATRAVTPAGLAAYFDQTILAGDAFKLKIPGQTRPEFFQMYNSEALFSGVYDPVLYWGYNVEGSGSRIDNTKSAIWQQFEYDYFVGGAHVQEWNFNIYDEANNQKRLMAFVSDKSDYKKTYWSFWIGDTGSSFFNIKDLATDTELFKVDGTNSTTTISQQTVINNQLDIGGGLIVSDNQVRIAGTKTPSSDFSSLKVAQTVNPTADIGINGLFNKLTITTPNSIAFNTIRGAYFYTTDITIGSGGATLSYAHNIFVEAAPTEATYGNWSLYSVGRSGFENGANFGCAPYDDETTDPVDIVTGTLRQRVEKTPSGAGDTGRTGQICWDANYIYVCTGTNAWKRAAISTW